VETQYTAAMTFRRGLLVVLLLLLLLGGGYVAVGALDDPGSASGHEAALVADPGVSTGADPEQRAAGSRERSHVGSGGQPGGRSEAIDGGTAQRGGAEQAQGSAPGEAVGEEEDDATEPGAAPDGAGAETEAARTITGRVVDAATDATLAGARILVVRTGRGWRATSTDETGAFVGIAPESTREGEPQPIELRIHMKGYHPQTVPWSGGDPVIKMQPRDHPPVPGAVEGLATDAAGTIVTGRILITSYDETGDYLGQWARANAGGAFRLDGLAPGHWRMRMVGGDGYSDVIVPEGGTASVHLRSGERPWPGELTREDFERRHRELSTPGRSRTDELRSRGRPGDAERSRGRAIQDLESRWRGVAAEREVVVTGLPDRDHMCLRAATTNGPNHNWRAPVRDGIARFRLTHERWTLILEEPGENDRLMGVDVKDGEGPMDVAWGAPD